MVALNEAWPEEAERTLGGALRSRAEAHPDKVALRFKADSWSYAALDAWVDRMATGLLEQGLAKGDMTALMLPNDPVFVALMFGCGRAGIVEVPINVAYKGQILRHLLTNSGAKLAVMAHEFLPRLAEIADELPELEKVVVWPALDGTEPDLPFDVLSFDVLDQDRGACPDQGVKPQDPLGIMYTSGTTGPSKGAVFSHNYLWWHGDRARTLRGVTADDVLYTCLPMFHANAQGITVMPAILAGATAVVDDKFTASGFWDRMRHYGTTQFNYIGGIIPILMKQPTSPADRDHSVRLALGAAAPKDQWTDFEERFGIQLFEVYGQSEDGVATANTPGDMKIGSIGKPIWGFEMQVVGDDDLPVADDTIGEFVVRPQFPDIMMQEYYRMPEATLEAFKNLWFHTGDYGWRDADGFFYFHDRKKDAMRRRGENISAFEVEQAVNGHPAVLESAAFAVPSDVGEDEVMVALILKDDAALDEIEFMEYCQKQMPYFAVPRYVDVRAEFPKTPTFRVEKYKLRAEGVTPTTWDREQAGFVLSRG
ncbi:AMP-binding protein [Marivita hallyeonensis]|uniref:Crotonobetaine/carnitine-CoA ligase n=1 Tax=Marivita hallyeonensis TaxID=996342 RepID=A0A1M5XNX6_9RHOB|nr:AMP-binding protein [Marivita hallyeonensis]SHI01254.1 crotonobetaine/carnitine-CoA ligase [Marivita hallyeonensis]